MTDPPTRQESSLSPPASPDATPPEPSQSCSTRPHPEANREKTPEPLPGQYTEPTHPGGQRLPPPQGTPRALKPSTHSAHYKDPTFKVKVNIEMDGKTCEIKFSTFLDETVPGRNMPKVKQQKLANVFSDLLRVMNDKSPSENRKEKRMYPVLCKAFNAIMAMAGSDDVFKDVADHPELSSSDMIPDLALYENSNKAITAYTLSEDELKKSQAHKDRKECLARNAWPWMVSFVEVKFSETSAAFHFSDPDQFVRKSILGENARAQLATYATEVMLRQHRTHLFALCVAGIWLRVTRWDRAGVLVSTAVNMVEDPVSVYNLLYRLARLQRWQQGYDPSVELASAKDIDKLVKYESTNPYFEKYRQIMLENQSQYPLYKVECGALEGPKDQPVRRKRAAKKSVKKSYLIGRFVSAQYSPTGRATRGYSAFDLSEGVLRFLKDQWRPNAPGTHPEWETYRRLKEHKVSFVATAIAGGDVEGPHQATLTQNYLNKRNGTTPIVERIHTRLVFKELGRTLISYTDSLELIRVCTQAFIAHKQAWEIAGILHRDISIGNIMIDVESASGNFRAFLNDWDLCKYKEDFEKYTVPTQPGGISGTWPFMSALTLLYPGKPHELADDLESFVYVLVYCAFRFHRHASTIPVRFADTPPKAILDLNAGNKGLAAQIDRMFYDDTRVPGGPFTAGDQKRLYIQSPTPPVKLTDKESEGAHFLAVLIKRLYLLLRRHYESIDYDALACYTAPFTGEPSLQSEPTLTESSPVFIDEFANFSNELARSRHPPAQPAPAPPPAPSPSPPEKHASVRRLLDDHNEMCDVFADIFKDPQTKEPLDLRNYGRDKIFDQFDNLYMHVDAPVKSAPSASTATATNRSLSRSAIGSSRLTPSGSHTTRSGSHSTRSGASKRTLDQAGITSSPEFKRARCHAGGLQMLLRPTGTPLGGS